MNVRPTASGTTGDLARWIREAAIALNLKLEWVSAPTASDAPGKAGQAAYDNDYLYVHIGTEWRRIALTSF